MAVESVDECDPPANDPTLIDCYWGQGIDGEDPVGFRVRLQADGTLTKVLGAGDLVAGAKSSKQTAALLDSDHPIGTFPTHERWTCRPSRRVGFTGQPTGSGATGQLCSTPTQTDRPAYRYVEFAPDGTATRDYAIHER